MNDNACDDLVAMSTAVQVNDACVILNRMHTTSANPVSGCWPPICDISRLPCK